MVNRNIYINYYNLKYNIEKIVNIIDDYKMISINDKKIKKIKKIKNFKKYKKYKKYKI